MAMRRRTRHWLLAGLATVALAIPALGQNAPESLLPPGFGEPVPAEAPRPQQPGPVQGPVAQPTPDKTASLPELLLNDEGEETGKEGEEGEEDEEQIGKAACRERGSQDG